MKLLKKILLITLIVASCITTIGCNKEIKIVNEFDEEKAKSESKEQLEKLLSLHEDSEVICKPTEVDKIKEIVDSEVREYITDDYYNDLQNKFKSSSYCTNSNDAFFIAYSSNKIYWCGSYNIYTPKVDKENETVIYKMDGRTMVSSIHLSVYLEMKKVDGIWKINKLSTAEKYNS